MSEMYRPFWAQMEGSQGWNRSKDAIKELVTNPLGWATNLIEDATQNRKDTPGVRHVNEAAWEQVEVALDVLKWLNDE